MYSKLGTILIFRKLFRAWGVSLWGWPHATTELQPVTLKVAYFPNWMLKKAYYVILMSCFFGTVQIMSAAKKGGYFMQILTNTGVRVLGGQKNEIKFLMGIYGNKNSSCEVFIQDLDFTGHDAC